MYNKDERIPLRLKCQHCLCKACAYAASVNEDTKHMEVYIRGTLAKWVVCPFCKRGGALSEAQEQYILHALMI